ncbi:type III polyketide synthase [Roseiarcaceae bacterium H3SJ34-1]|uniref:type III polyketide synthase n=1 Tax=Terripilifer ovatus TaxID=3032367 RepID=UPI003AB985B9|nr:type III polyketide synthase [Roseiarcaceae bacterium H3SJ34-1]
MVALLSVATAVPSHVFPQTEVARRASLHFGGRYADFERMAQVFASAGIERRYGIMPMDWYGVAHGWPERTAAFTQGATALLIAAADKAIRNAGLTAADIDTIVTVCSTGIATPSLEARAAQSMDFRPDVARVPVFGLGCAGGVTGLGVAAKLARAAPGANVLFVTVEACTLAVRLDQMSKANIVATALFGDGAAACVLREGDRGRGLARIETAAEYMWRNTLGIMGWSVDVEGFGVIFDRSIPPFAVDNLGAAMTHLLTRMNIARKDVDRFVCHPGGPKVIEAIEAALALPAGSLDHERQVLAAFGNMSAPTVLFVLERLLAAGLPRKSVLAALGPGFTLSALSLSANA